MVLKREPQVPKAIWIRGWRREPSIPIPCQPMTPPPMSRISHRLRRWRARRPTPPLPACRSDVAAEVLSETSVKVTWTASTDNVGVAGYNIYRNGVLCAGTSEEDTFFVDSELSSCVTYTYTVSAYDASENESDESEPVTVNMDTTDPTAGTASSPSVVTSGLNSRHLQRRVGQLRSGAGGVVV
jgi:hypothetical protein